MLRPFSPCAHFFFLNIRSQNLHRTVRWFDTPFVITMTTVKRKMFSSFSSKNPCNVMRITEYFVPKLRTNQFSLGYTLLKVDFGKMPLIRHCMWFDCIEYIWHFYEFSPKFHFISTGLWISPEYIYIYIFILSNGGDCCHKIHLLNNFMQTNENFRVSIYCR